MTEGRIISGRYRLLSKLGQGGMGSVYRAVHLELGTPVAVKLIDPVVAESKVALARFKREAQAAASLRSNHVVQIFDYGVDDETPYIVMELLEGESLAARIARQSVLAPNVIIGILGQVAKALERAHAMNIVHRDLKPDNIFLIADGEDVTAKVLDFGIAKTETSAVFDASIQTKSGAILGTPHYMSPEQASGRGSVDHRADIWALGVIVFECFTGFRPFTGNTLGGLVISICSDPIPRPSERGTVPHGLDAWFAKAVCRNKEERFSSMSEALHGLRLVCESSHGESLTYTYAGLTRERTAIVEDGQPGTVSPSSHTVSGISNSGSYRKWGIAAALIAGLGFASWFGRSWTSSLFPGVMPQASTVGLVAVSATPVDSSVDAPSTASAVSTLALVSANRPTAAMPSASSSSASESARAPSLLRKGTAALRAPSSSAMSDEDPSGITPPRSASVPARQKTSAKSVSVVVEASSPTNTTQPSRNVEDRLAF